MSRKSKQAEDAAPAPAASFDANREQEVRDALKDAQADLQSARERSQSPSFVPAESDESKAFAAAQREVAEFEAAKAKADAEAAGVEPVPFIPAPVEPEPEQ